MNLIVLKNKYSIFRFSNESGLPEWIYSSEFYSVTRTNEEFSVVTLQNDSIRDELICSKDWRIIKIEGPLDFSMTGIIAGISAILLEKEISIFVISTYDTDYILVKQNDLGSAIETLRKNEYIVSSEK
jgi:uncharacterized protein